MEISDLVAIGKLGRLEPDGFHCVQFSPSYKSVFNQLKECFLIFNSHRVYFVTVVEKKAVKNRMYFRFLEDGVAEECSVSKNVTVALMLNEISDSESDSIDRILGYKVVYELKEIGVITDAMIMPMQSLFIIKMNDNRKLMVPYVEYYVKDIDDTNMIVRMQNLEQLIEICTSTS